MEYSQSSTKFVTEGVETVLHDRLRCRQLVHLDNIEKLGFFVCFIFEIMVPEADPPTPG